MMFGLSAGQLCIGFSILLALLWLRSKHKQCRSEEPPYLPWSLVRTFVQHIPGLITRRLLYFDDLATKWKKPIFTIPMICLPIYVVTSSDFLTSVQKQSRLLSFQFFVGYFAPRIVGGNKRTLESFIANIHNGVESENMLLEGGKLTKKVLSSQGGTQMTNSAIELVRDRLMKIACNDLGAPIDLWEWVKHEMTLSSTGALYGAHNPYKDPKVETGFWKFVDQVLWLGLMSPFPKSVVSRLLSGYEGREVVVQAMTDYFLAGKHEHASQLVKTQHPCFAKHLDYAEVARFEIANALGAVGNSVPTAFWVLYHIFSNQQLLDQARRQVASKMTDISREGAHIVNLTKLSEAPIFFSIVEEVLRHRSKGIGVRVVMEDAYLTEGQEQYRLRKGGIIVITHGTVHKDERTWGKDADSFSADRFCKGDTSRKAFRSFGNGPTACCGRQFATRHIASLAVMMVTLFDLIPVGSPCGGWIEPGMDGSVAVGQLAGPIKKVSVRMVPRRTVQGDVWRFAL